VGDVDVGRLTGLRHSERETGMRLDVAAEPADGALG
jgi:hypothetical protein